ncbi:MAG TPA: thiamine-phosphate kinase [Thermoleophilaceae bacterium]|jgi:thiamine-monophosphate kinase
MGERDLIRVFQGLAGPAGGRLLRGSGDDAAVARAGGVVVTSIDAVVDGVHFERATHSLADVGHKALARGLSDLAAMGAEPGEAYVALAVPGDAPADLAEQLGAGLMGLAEATGTAIAGGDVTAGPVLSLTVAVNGWAGSADELAYRDGAKPGDLAGVTGELGGAAAGLLLLREAAPGGSAAPDEAAAPGAPPGLSAAERDALLLRHRRPTPLLAAGRALAAAGASAMIDLSDGLATDAAHVAEASGVAVELRLEALPVAAGVEAVAAAAGRDPLELAAAGGDDYELLVTAPPERREAVEAAARAAGTWVRWLGRVEAGAGVRLVGPGGSPVALGGFEHRV